jgi:PKD repeat protein
MKKIIFLFCCLLGLNSLSAQQISDGEYFIDTDPGCGNGTPIPMVATADSVDVNFTVPVTGLGVGFHKLYVRYRDDLGQWSLHEQKLFYIYDTTAPSTPAQAPQIVAMEYFFDNVDAGPGTGAYLNPFTPADSLALVDYVIAQDPLFLTPLTPGSHILHIRAQDADGAWGMTRSFTFTVCDQPASSFFTYSVSGTDATFSNTSSNDFGTKWIFGDGNFSTDTSASVSHTYNNGGTINVCMISYSGCGNDTACNLVTLNCVSPTANFTSTVNSNSVSFTSTSTGGFTYSWNFGDSKSSSLANPTHVYSAAGTYTVCLTVSNSCGSNTICKTITTTCVAPVANYSVNINGYTATITNLSTNAANFLWNFGDATTNNVDYDAVHQYAAAGSYNLKLTVSNGCGANIKQGSITIACAAPVVSFDNITDGLDMEVSNNSSNGTSWLWDFGDGTTSPFKNPAIHTFPSTGTYTVCLKATNSCGVDSVCNEVTVCAAPTAEFTSSANATDVSFTNTSTNGVYYLWNFADGNITNIPSPNYQFASSGLHVACLTASNSCGTDSVCHPMFLFCSSGIQPEICLVTVDSLSAYNEIYWNKSNYMSSDTFLVYRDTANNDYALIGKVPFDSLSMFVDTVRTLFIASGNPNVTSWRYKIAVEDSCGNIGMMSPYHQTMFIQNTNGNFSWNHYQVQGQIIPVPSLSNYLFQRDDLSNGNWNTIQSVSASSTAFTDPNWSTFQSTASWIVRTNWTVACDPTLKLSPGAMAAVTKSRSNIQNNMAVSGIKSVEKNEIALMPNPARNSVSIQLPKISVNVFIEVYDAMGKIILSKNAANTGEVNLNTENLAGGIYFVRIISDNEKTIKKLVITE